MIVDIGSRLHLEVDPGAPVHSLLVGERQRVEDHPMLAAGRTDHHGRADRGFCRPAWFLRCSQTPRSDSPVKVAP